jgi:dTDP-glucose 4,6-dehydratase
MSERFLVLGANSFYGRNFVNLVRERGDAATELSRPRFDLDRDGDLALFQVAMDAEPDYVVNFISKSLVAESWEWPYAWMLTNAANTSWLFEEARLCRVRRFIHVSTPEVYGSTRTWVDESCRFNPTTPYAVSRAAGDMMLKAYHNAYGFPAIITRTANIYGPGQQSHRLIPKAFEYLREARPLPLHGAGESVRSFIHIKDACEATYLICKQGKVGETYHISTEKAHRIAEVVDMIGCKTTEANERLGKDYAYLLNSDKLRAMGWKDNITLEQGLCELSR